MATSLPSNSETISLKLLVDGDSNRVLFAEAGKEFVDFLFGLLHIPVGSIMGLLWNHGIAGAGSFARVFESIQNLDSSYLLQRKESLLMPKPAFPSNNLPPPLLQNFLLPEEAIADEDEVVLHEVLFHDEDSDPEDGFRNEVFGQHKEAGLVRGGMMYMVMDDLRVKPASTISSITLLNSFNVKDIGCLQEKMVNIDIKKGLELVKASFGSATVLTDVFLGNNVLDELP